MGPKTTIRQLLERGEFIWAPCIYDCLSARCAELTGYNAILLSSCELEYGMNGTPASLANWEEFIMKSERIARASSLPLIVDADNAGGNPMQVYRNCRRLAEAGVMAITVEDSESGGLSCGYHYRTTTSCMDRNLFATNIHAAVDAVKGTGCMIIARTNSKGGGSERTGSFGQMGGLGLDLECRWPTGQGQRLPWSRTSVTQAARQNAAPLPGRCRAGDSTRIFTAQTGRQTVRLRNCRNGDFTWFPTMWP